MTDIFSQVADHIAREVAKPNVESRMTTIEFRDLHHLRDTLKKLRSIDKQDWMLDLFWERFCDRPLRTFLTTNDENAQRLWELIKP